EKSRRIAPAAFERVSGYYSRRLRADREVVVRVVVVDLPQSNAEQDSGQQAEPQRRTGERLSFDGRADAGIGNRSGDRRGLSDRAAHDHGCSSSTDDYLTHVHLQTITIRVGVLNVTTKTLQACLFSDRLRDASLREPATSLGYRPLRAIRATGGAATAGCCAKPTAAWFWVGRNKRPAGNGSGGGARSPDTRIMIPLP